MAVVLLDVLPCLQQRLSPDIIRASPSGDL